VVVVGLLRLTHTRHSKVKMPGSVMSVFNELDDFQTALREDGVLNLQVTIMASFAGSHAVTVYHLRRSADDGSLSRIA
jgi:hypothetical protein